MVATPEDNSLSVTTSTARLRANRENAKKSTGPRTDTGKAVSRRNATSHGILVSSAVLRDGPDAETLRGIFSSLCDELTPVGELERLQVETIAVSYWRLGRTYAAEARLRKPEIATTEDVAPSSKRGLRALDAIAELRRQLPRSLVAHLRAEERLEAFEAEVFAQVEEAFTEEVQDFMARADDPPPSEDFIPSEYDAERLGRYTARIMKEISWAYSFLLRLQEQRSI